MASTSTVKSFPRLFSLGRVVKCLPQMGGTHESRPIVKVRVMEQEFDNYYKAYFDKPVVQLAYVGDALLQSKTEVSVGDSVLLKRLSKTVQNMEHEVDRVVLKRGHIVDPINKCVVVNGKYLHETKTMDTFINEALKDTS